MKQSLLTVMVSSALTGLLLTSPVMASGPASGPTVGFRVEGHIGEVIVNPYKVAPLTAVIRNGGYALTNASVRIVPKAGGQEIKYTVSDDELLTHAGIPVFGLYPDYVNTVEVTYTRLFNGKKETFTDAYKFWIPPVATESRGNPDQVGNMLRTEVIKTSPKYADRLYLVNNIAEGFAKGDRVFWNNPTGGALTWNEWTDTGIIDSKGDLRWYLDPRPIFDFETIYWAGAMMGFRQNDDGTLTWGYGQRYAKYDIMGRELWNRRLPHGLADFSHSLDAAQNGHYFLRVSSADYRRPDGKRVHTVRDVIAEIDQTGRVVDQFNLWDILDPYRDNVLKALDQGAVCLHLDATKVGHTMTAEELAQQDKNDNFGDLTGVGPGRNWAHVNSVDYDPTDDSIIISSRHQSAIVKIGRDKKVKWILASPEGWKGDLAKKLLKPVEKNGKAVSCTGSKCEGNFDWTWTQHTAFRIDSKSDQRYLYLTAFDNGDGRGMEQPALPEMKYSRGVVYKIDQQNMTVEQVWEHGKDEGFEYYSPVTGLCEYQKDKDSVVVYYSTAGFSGWRSGKIQTLMHPYITEFDWGAKEPSVIIKIKSSMGYQAFPFDLQKAFNHRPAK